MPGRVLNQTCARATAPTAALIEYHDAIMARIEKLAGAFVGSRTRTAVQKHRGFAGRIAAFLVIDLVNFRNPQEPVAKRLYRRIESPARRTRVLRRTGRRGACSRRPFDWGSFDRRQFGWSPLDWSPFRLCCRRRALRCVQRGLLFFHRLILNLLALFLNRSFPLDHGSQRSAAQQMQMQVIDLLTAVRVAIED